MPSDVPPLDLLEATHRFPCPYMFKVIGKSEEHFVGRAVVAVRQHLDPTEEPPFSSRSTTGGRHVCVTIEPVMRDAQHVLDVYQSLRELAGVVMLL